jgi:hypothetical protein
MLEQLEQRCPGQGPDNVHFSANTEETIAGPVERCMVYREEAS